MTKQERDELRALCDDYPIDMCPWEPGTFGFVATEALPKLLDEIERLERHEKAYSHALDCVDEAFQTNNGRTETILPDFCKCGDNKFEAVVRLAKAYKELQGTDKSPHQQRIEQFMSLAGQDVPASPCLPREEVRLLRAKLIFEEAMETIAALGVRAQCFLSSPYLEVEHVEFFTFDTCNKPIAPNLVEIADGCADLSVVSIGTLSACGIADEALLAEVDESNLRKFGPGGYRRADGKWVKPPGWTPPNVLKAIGVE